MKAAAAVAAVAVAAKCASATSAGTGLRPVPSRRRRGLAGIAGKTLSFCVDDSSRQ